MFRYANIEKVKRMEAHHQLMIEKMQRVEDALLNAEQQKATEEDWQIIFNECGIERKKYEFDSKRT
jgi:hypothetical protein